MIRTARLLLILCLLLSACSAATGPMDGPPPPTATAPASASPAPSAAPHTAPAAAPSAAPSAVPHLDPAQLKAALAGTPLPAGPAEAERQIHQMQREPVRPVLGDQADDFFRRMDAAEWALARSVLDQMPGSQGRLPVSLVTLASDRPLLVPSWPLRSEAWPSLPQSDAGLGTLVAVLGGMAGYSDLPEGQPWTSHESVDVEGVQAQIDIKISRQGSTMRLRTASQSTGSSTGRTLRKAGSAQAEVQLCPDEGGVALASYAIDWAWEATDGGAGVSARYHIDGISRGQVSDEANLVGITHDLSSDIDVRSVGPDASPKARADVRLRFSSAHPSSTSFPGDLQIEIRSAQQQDGDQAALDKLLGDAIAQGVLFAQVMLEKAFQDAEKKWKDGYCLEVAVDGFPGAGPDASVYPGSKTPFAAHVHHKFENRDLALPIESRLSGEQSVTPGGSNQSPVNYTYLAPGEPDKLAYLRLETRSRRGIAWAMVEFKTVPVAFLLTAKVTDHVEWHITSPDLEDFTSDVLATLSLVIHPQATLFLDTGTAQLSIAEMYHDYGYDCTSDIAVPVPVTVESALSGSTLELWIQINPGCEQQFPYSCWVQHAPIMMPYGVYLWETIELGDSDTAVKVSTGEACVTYFEDRDDNLQTWEVKVERQK